MTDYTIKRVEHGLVVEGLVPLSELGAINKMAAGLGFDILDGLLSQHFHVTMVFTSRKHSKAWRAELRLEDTVKP